MEGDVKETVLVVLIAVYLVTFTVWVIPFIFIRANCRKTSTRQNFQLALRSPLFISVHLTVHLISSIVAALLILPSHYWVNVAMCFQQRLLPHVCCIFSFVEVIKVLGDVLRSFYYLVLFTPRWRRFFDFFFYPIGLAAIYLLLGSFTVTLGYATAWPHGCAGGLLLSPAYIFLPLRAAIHILHLVVLRSLRRANTLYTHTNMITECMRSFYISIGQDLPIFIVVILHDVGIMTNHQAQSIVVSPLILLGSLLFFIFGVLEPAYANNYAPSLLAQCTCVFRRLVKVEPRTANGADRLLFISTQPDVRIRKAVSSHQRKVHRSGFSDMDSLDGLQRSLIRRDAEGSGAGDHQKHQHQQQQQQQQQHRGSGIMREIRRISNSGMLGNMKNTLASTDFRKFFHTPGDGTRMDTDDISLDEILTMMVVRQELVNFCTSLGCGNEAAFMVDATRFRDETPEEEASDFASSIMSTYLEPHSPRLIRVKKEILSATQTKVKDYITSRGESQQPALFSIQEEPGHRRSAIVPLGGEERAVSQCYSDDGDERSSMSLGSIRYQVFALAIDELLLVVQPAFEDFKRSPLFVAWVQFLATGERLMGLTPAEAVEDAAKRQKRQVLLDRLV